MAAPASAATASALDKRLPVLDVHAQAENVVTRDAAGEAGRVAQRRVALLPVQQQQAAAATAAYVLRGSAGRKREILGHTNMMQA
eukprot:359883-Chlamydomonas_euryale.AAC.2